MTRRTASRPRSRERGGLGAAWRLWRPISKHPPQRITEAGFDVDALRDESATSTCRWDHNLGGVGYGLHFQVLASIASGGGSTVNILLGSRSRACLLRIRLVQRPGTALVGLPRAGAADHGRDAIRVECSRLWLQVDPLLDQPSEECWQASAHFSTSAWYGRSRGRLWNSAARRSR